MNNFLIVFVQSGKS